MPLGLGSLKGNRMPRVSSRRGAGAGHDRLPSSQKRGAMSLVAFISSDAALQKDLPQVLIGNKHKLTKKVMGALRSDARLGRLQVWKEESGWVSHKLMKDLLKTLSEALQHTNSH